jgi:hypothetical protein
MRTIKTYRKVGAFYIACEADFATPIRTQRFWPQFQCKLWKARRRIPSIGRISPFAGKAFKGSI